MLDKSIFREYDIRGIVKTQLKDEDVVAIASAYATVFKRENKKKIALGMDGRESSRSIKNLTAKTLASFGLDVVDIGLVPTPLMYYAVFKYDMDGGIIITASHNPAEYNGFKALIGKEAISGKQVEEIYHIGNSGNYADKGEGSIVKQDLIDDYIEYINNDLKINRKIKVVVDSGNGTGGITAIPLYKKLGVEVIDIYSEVDGNFPNHHPDPTKVENLKDLMAKVKETDADIGISFDGDADRIGVVDKEGNILWGDMMMIIFAKEILKAMPGSTFISEVKASEVMYEEIKKMGGKPIMWKAGHSLIKKKIVETGAVLAGEVSGHMFFNDRWFGFDDAVYTGARLIEILSNSDLSLTEMIMNMPKVVNTPEIRVDTGEEEKFKIVRGVRDYFKEKYEVIDIDGARVKFKNGWALVRASNTQPSLVIRFEADTEPHLEKIKGIFYPVLEKVKKEIETGN